MPFKTTYSLRILKINSHDFGNSKRDAAYRFFSTTLKLPRGLKAHQEKYDESSIEVVDENNLKLFSYQQRPKNELKGNDAVIAYLQLELQ